MAAKPYVLADGFAPDHFEIERPLSDPLPDGTARPVGTAVEEVTWRPEYGGGWWFHRTVIWQPGLYLSDEQLERLEDDISHCIYPEDVAFWLDRYGLPYSERLKTHLAARRRQAFRRLYPDAPEQADYGDGPDGNEFRWKGKSCTGLSRLRFALLSFLWKYLGRPVGPEALEASVWSDADVMTDDALRSAASDVNGFFEDHQLPLHIKVTGKGSLIRATLLLT